MKTQQMKRGSALLVALWIVAVLSVMVFSFAFEAHQQAGINLFVRERNRVNRLVEPGRLIGEAVLLGYANAVSWTKGEDEKELDEDDRFYLEKRALKDDSKCTIGPILLDEDDEESGVVTIEIQLANAGAENGVNINELYSGGDQNYALRWQMILMANGINEELEVEVKDADGRGTSRHNLMNLLIAGWNNWRDEDGKAISKGPLADCEPEENDGVNAAWYEEANQRALDEAHSEDARNAARENARIPRNAAIPDIKELADVRGFYDFPAVLTGGLLHPDEETSEENPTLKGLVNLNIFCTSGSAKLNVNDCTADQLMTIPGIFDEDATDDGDTSDAEEIAHAIVDALKIMPDDDEVDETRDWWPYKDWNDMKTRVEDNFDVELGDEIQQYVCFKPENTDVFKMKITAESMGMKHEVVAECYVKDSKVRYISWRED